MMDCTERHLSEPGDGLAGEGRESMTGQAQSEF